MLKIDLVNHLGDVNRILKSALKEPWKYDYPEHLDKFRNLRTSMIEEMVKETNFTKNLANVMHNLNKTINIIKKL